MEKSEQRFVMKFLFIKGLGAQVIERKLTAVLGANAFSLSQVKE
jgi:hypothetical protein